MVCVQAKTLRVLVAVLAIGGTTALQIVNNGNHYHYYYPADVKGAESAPAHVAATFSQPAAADVSAASNTFMDCGEGVALCGVLTLQTGLGSGNYRHPTPSVHGLWPQDGRFGNSECLPPQSTTSLSYLTECYRAEGSLSFQTHEWTKHGVCAGVKDAQDYFTQLCDLAQAPLQVMATARASGGGLSAITSAVQDKGYGVYNTMSHTSEILLSVCAKDGQWKLSAVADFASVCGDGSTSAQFSAAIAKESCVPNKRGPPCSSDSECSSVPGCLRCAKSGFCTSTDLKGGRTKGYHSSNEMFCGNGVSICGVLTLETGLGTNKYQHTEPVVHGLWPQTGQHGNSKCVPPTNTSFPFSQPYACYTDLSFQKHEWTAHGLCANGPGAKAYFDQICSLAAPPLQVMKTAREQPNSDLTTIAAAVTQAGYEIEHINADSSKQELLLSACKRERDGQWILTPEDKFEETCGNGTMSAMFGATSFAATSEGETEKCAVCCTKSGGFFQTENGCNKWSDETCAWVDDACVLGQDDVGEDETDLNSHAATVDSGTAQYIPTKNPTATLQRWDSSVGFFTFTDVTTGGAVLSAMWSSTARRKQCVKGLKRAKSFKSCDQLPGVRDSSYTNTHWTRGHQVASGGGGLLYQNAKATFSVCNIVPQTAGFNSGSWQKLEYATQKFALNRNALVLTGSTFESIQGFNDCICKGHAGTVACGTCDALVKVPTGQFKVVVDLENDVGNAYVFLSTGVGTSFPSAQDKTLLNITSNSGDRVPIDKMFRSDFPAALAYINKFSKVMFDSSKYALQSSCPPELCDPITQQPPCP